jgi:hypothetical protein
MMAPGAMAKPAAAETYKFHRCSFAPNRVPAYTSRTVLIGGEHAARHLRVV